MNELRTLFSYDPTTGLITRLRGRSDFRGPLSNKLMTVRVAGKATRTSRLAWALHHGYWPTLLIDHRDGNPLNNKLSNLREATPTQNQHNKVGFGKYPKGVTYKGDVKRNTPYLAKIRIGGTRLHLGCFATAREASQAYQEAAAKYQGEFSLASR